jgi:serine/threonine-protein kinase
MKRDDLETEPATAATVDAASVDLREADEPPPARVVAGRYEILGLIGSGGMGTVYRARDQELDEIVALKMLRKRLASDADALERFRREVKLARRVTHRNVARTFDIGEHAGGKFLTMELVDGEMLRSRLARTGSLPVAEAVRIASEVCTGLAAAHAAGVLHRDLKPENVIVARDDRVVITDFGIARALSAGEASASAHEIVGTPAYMAPEQLESAQLDERTDVYALGVMLFELLTGVVPWANESPIRAALARMREPAPDVRTERPSISAALAHIVATCMATKREDRHRSAEEVGRALAELAAIPQSAPSLVPARPAARPAARATVAILPLVNTGDPAVGYLAESVTDDVVDVLGGLQELLVVHAPATSLDPRAAGRALGVHAVVAGTFRHDADRIQVSLALTTVEDGFEIWSQTFARPIADIASLGDEIARGIAGALSTRVSSFPRALPTDRVAYDLFLRGRSVFLRGWYDASGEAIRLFAEAHARCPDNATIVAAHARALARAYGVDASGDASQAQQIAERAVSLDPSRAEARVALALMHLYRGDGVGAATELARAVASAPGDPDVLELLGRLRAEVGPLDAAAGHLAVVLAREPAFTEARLTLARVHALRGAWSDVDALLGPAPADVAARVPHVLTRARLLGWTGDRARIGEELAGLADVELRVRERRIAELLLGVAARRALTDEDRAALAELFPTGAAIAQRRAAFNAQIRTEVLLAGADHERAIEAIGDADANGLLDEMWLLHCPLLDPVRGSWALGGVLRRTGLRAARVRDLLDRP